MPGTVATIFEGLSWKMFWLPQTGMGAFLQALPPDALDNYQDGKIVGFAINR